jgi:hypothetical protein
MIDEMAFECRSCRVGTKLRYPARSRCSKTRLCKYVCVAVARFNFDPIVFDGFIHSPLKISVSHHGEVIASKYAAWTNFIFKKNVDDLAPDIVIRWGGGHSHENTCMRWRLGG